MPDVWVRSHSSYTEAIAIRFTKRTFDGVLLIVLLTHVAFSAPKVWAARKSADPSTSAPTAAVAGAVNIAL